MTERLIEVSDSAVRLSVRSRQLAIHRDGEVSSTPLEEVGVLVLATPAMTLSASVLTDLAEQGALVVCCNRNWLPEAMMLPMQRHGLQSERFARQCSQTEPGKKRLWKQLVKAKIAAQATALERLGRKEVGLLALAARVRSGDPDNIEAQAARRYWPVVFDDPGFRRGHEYGGRNAMLNYGYTVLRAAAARALCAAGLHPSLGLQHHNRYDPFCLASDLMEPFRPLVDLRVAEWCAGLDEPDGELTRDCRANLLEALVARYRVAGEERELGDILRRAAQSLAAVILGRENRIVLPLPEPAS